MSKDLALSKSQEVAKKAIATINPAQYVAAVYEPFNIRIANAIETVKGIEYDIKTTAGMEEAKKARALFREIRLDADKERKTQKEPFLLITKLLETGNNDVFTAIEPYETKFDADIKAEEKRKEDIKAEEIRKESERLAALEEKINEIKNAPLQAVNWDSVKTQAKIDELSVIVPTATVYEERTVEAEILIEQTILTLKQMADGKRAQEQLAHQQKQAAEESMRLNNIKSKIADIRNAILDGAEIEESAKLKVLIDRVEKTQINVEVFQEFAEEATQARDSVIKALKRQFDALVNAEAQAKAQQETIIDDTRKGGDFGDVVGKTLQQQSTVNEAKPQVVESESVTLSAQKPVDQSESSLSLKRPTDEQIIAVVVLHFKADELSVIDWIDGVDTSKARSNLLRKLAA